MANEDDDDQEQPSSSSNEPRATAATAALEIDGSDSNTDIYDDEYLDEQEQVSLMLGRRKQRRRGASYDSYEDHYHHHQRSPYLPIYLGGATVLVLLAAVVFVPSQRSSNKQSLLVCESVYTDDTSWNSFLQRIDQQDPADRCRNDAPRPKKKSKACQCKNPLEPNIPTEPPSWKRNWQHGFQSNLDLVAKETRQHLDVILLGDSITEQWHGTSFGRPNPRYSAKAKVYQRLFVNETTAQVQGLALGISGDRCPQLLYRITNGELPAELPQPRVWWILIGTNDYLSDACSVDSIVAGNIRIVQQLLSRPHSKNAKVVINSLLPVGNNAQGGIIQHAKDYLDVNQRLECFANGHERVFFFNATSIFLTASSQSQQQNTGVVVNKTLLPDGLHPSAVASELWGQAIVNKVLEIEKRRPGG